MRIEELIPLYEKANADGDETLSSEIYCQMIEVFIKESELDFDTDEDVLADIIEDGISAVFSDYYLEKIVKEGLAEPLIDENGDFSYQVSVKGKVYLKKLEDIYGTDVIKYC